MADEFSATEKLQCARREVGWRRRVYPMRVATGRMTQAQAEREMALMRSIEADYRALAEADTGPLFSERTV